MNTEKPLTYLLGQTMNMVKLKLLSTFKDNSIELTLEHFIILHYLSEKEDLTQQDLANHFLRDKSIILRQINTLIDLRYIVRITDKDDKRKKNLILTKKGYDMLVTARQTAEKISAELLTGVTEEELIHFENVIQKIQHNTGHKNEGCNC
ncbi:MarR family winged helix-turn-helix transcriptional regulator [Mangrovibacterium lignilyticum]|uniref:MarR family winged helix-turn-helix transcriptional regulator n=1 Tax=Mangrovibacterium lignilyticum TaxID=2668052 RepID=UPI0013D160ED|nr:MarR family transcriptional regulator [Mangrovibacterium lignilyticum]